MKVLQISEHRQKNSSSPCARGLRKLQWTVNKHTRSHSASDNITESYRKMELLKQHDASCSRANTTITSWYSIHIQAKYSWVGSDVCSTLNLAWVQMPSMPVVCTLQQYVVTVPIYIHDASYLAPLLQCLSTRPHSKSKLSTHQQSLIYDMESKLFFSLWMMQIVFHDVL